MKLFLALGLLLFISGGNTARAQAGDESYARAMQLYYTGQFQLAEKSFTESINNNPDQPTAYLYRGNCYASLHLFKEAKKDYDNASKTLRDNPELDFGIGYLYNEMGDYKKAIPYLDKAIAINPRYALAYNTRGVSYQSLGNPRVAIENYSQAIKSDSALAIAYNNRGTAIYENQDIAKATNLDIRNAIKDLDKAISLDATLCVAKRNRGLAYSFLNKNDLALIDLDAAIECDKKNVTYYINRGVLLTKIGEYFRAISDFKDALGYNPKCIEAEILMGEAYEKSGDLQQGVVCEMTAAIMDKKYNAITNYKIAGFYATFKDKELMMKYLKLAKRYGYFSTNDNLGDFLKNPQFLGFRNDQDFQKFRHKVRGNRM